MPKCDQCGKELKNDLALKIHVGRMHSGKKKTKAAPKKTAKGALACKICGRTFKMPAHLARHGASHGKGRKARRVGRPVGRQAAGAASGRLDVQSLTIDDLLAVKRQVDARLSSLVRQLRAAKVKV